MLLSILPAITLFHTLLFGQDELWWLWAGAAYNHFGGAIRRQYCKHGTGDIPFPGEVQDRELTVRYFLFAIWYTRSMLSEFIYNYFKFDQLYFLAKLTGSGKMIQMWHNLQVVPFFL